MFLRVHAVLLYRRLLYHQIVVRAHVSDANVGFLPLICLIALLSSHAVLSVDVFRVITSVLLEFILCLRSSLTEVHWLHAALGAHAHSNVADHEDESDGENGEEDDQVLDCVSHGSLLFFNDLGLGHLRDQELLLFLGVLSI